MCANIRNMRCIKGLLLGSGDGPMAGLYLHGCFELSVCARAVYVQSPPKGCYGVCPVCVR
jgi:hypothetical protein